MIRQNRLIIIGLLGPVMLLIGIFFVAPISLYLYRAIDNSELSSGLPNTIPILATWDGSSALPDAAYAALHQDLSTLQASQSLGKVARRLNYNVVGFREMVMKAGRLAISDGDQAVVKREMISADARWQDLSYWRVLKQEAGATTPLYLLASVDLKETPAGDIGRTAPDQRLYVSIYLRTIWISACVTVLCLLLGYPTAYVLSSARPRTAGLLMLLLMIPFWTSLLVRTISWVIILQDTGPLNSFLVATGLIGKPAALLYTRFSVIIAMTHVLLPFMVLPLYSTMKAIDPVQMRAASSLGGGPFFAFRNVYLPQTKPGVAAGCLLVFILALGYYITPAVVGGPADQMISYYIAFFTNQTINWGLGAALSVGLLLISLLLFVAYARVVDMKSMRLS